MDRLAQASGQSVIAYVTLSEQCHSHSHSRLYFLNQQTRELN